MIRQSLAVAAAFTPLLRDAAFAQQLQRSLTNKSRTSCEEFSALVIGRKISTTFPDGTRPGGAALAVRPEALVPAAALPVGLPTALGCLAFS